MAEVTAACEAALGESLAWLEREACFVRRGTNNRQARVDPAEFGTRRMIAEGFVAARFPHRTSRLGDPHLHWPVLVAHTASFDRRVLARYTAFIALEPSQGGEVCPGCEDETFAAINR